jgi:hypothetical protein
LKRRYNLYDTPLRQRNAVTAAKRRYGREKSVTDKKNKTEEKESHYVRLRIKILNKYLLAGESE